MTTYNEVLAVAKSHLGHYGEHARSFCHLGSGQPYCCAFVRMCTSKAGGAKLFYDGKMVTYCPNAIKWCKANLAELPFYLSMPMDFIFFDWQPNYIPDHIGFVYEKISTDKLKTLEGNTSGGIVATKTRGPYVQGVFRPHYTPNKKLEKKILDCDGDFGYQSIYMLQVALGMKSPTGIFTKDTVKALQKKVGVVQDGSWSKKTSRAVQSKLCGLKGKAIDGDFGPKSVTALQNAINDICYPKSTKIVQPSSEPTRSAVKKTEPKKKKTTAPKPNPQGAYSGSIAKPVLRKGMKGEEVKKLQKFYEWYFDNVKFKNYGTFGEHTEAVQKAFQKAHGLKQTGIYGVSSCKKANAYKHKTNQQKLLDKMKELAWAYGTAKKKYDYKNGAPKKVCKEALKKYGWADSKAEMSDCGNNVTATVREAGVSKLFKALHGTKTPFPKTEKDFNIVIKGRKIKKGELKPADIVRYKKHNGNQHVLFYMGDGKVCEASHHNRYFAIVKDKKKYNNSLIAKTSTVQVLRAKE